MRDDLRWPVGFLVVALLATAITPGADGADLPVVFIPGTGGTRLVERRPDGERRVWIAPSLLQEADGNDGEAGIDRMMLTTDGEDGHTKLVAAETLRTLSLGVHLELRVSDPETTRNEDSYTTRGLIDLKRFSVPVYGDFFDWAQGQWSSSGGFYDVPYDWRKGGCEASDVAIGAKVDQAIQKSGQSQVVLVAHSLGGLVARHYLCQGQNAKKVRALIAVGTPWLGSPKTARALRYGYSFGLGGRVDPPDEYIAKGIYIYATDRRESVRVRYPTIVSLLDPLKTKALAKTLPCVFQQLPTPEYAEFYARAIGSSEQRESVLLGETWDQTLQTFEDANGKLFKAAQEVRERILYNGNHGVSHVLIAGTLDPKIAPELAMDMRMSEETEQNAALRWVGLENEITSPFALISALRTTGPPFFDALKSNFKRLRAGEKITPEAMKALANRFFGLVPLFEDFGNYNWQYAQTRASRTCARRRNCQSFSNTMWRPIPTRCHSIKVHRGSVHDGVTAQPRCSAPRRDTRTSCHPNTISTRRTKTTCSMKRPLRNYSERVRR